MRAKNLGFASAILASTCCVVPVGLAVLGLGSLGLGSLIGTYHWYFLGAAVVLLAVGWGYFLREKRRTEALGSDLRNERTTRNSLALASGVVAFFLGLNVYAVLGGSGGVGAVAVSTQAVAGETIIVPVRGMSCVACEVPIESNLRKIDGVLEADASAQRSDVVVTAKPGAVSVEAIADAVRAAGYEPDTSAATRGS
ncbi:MAG: heavy-metal-associated domain-containing protein [Candidatus Binatia bacterium]